MCIPKLEDEKFQEIYDLDENEILELSQPTYEAIENDFTTRNTSTSSTEWDKLYHYPGCFEKNVSWPTDPIQGTNYEDLYNLSIEYGNQTALCKSSKYVTIIDQELKNTVAMNLLDTDQICENFKGTTNLIVFCQMVFAGFEFSGERLPRQKNGIYSSS